MSQNINITCKFNFGTEMLEKYIIFEKSIWVRLKDPVGYVDVNYVTWT